MLIEYPISQHGFRGLKQPLTNVEYVNDSIINFQSNLVTDQISMRFSISQEGSYVPKINSIPENPQGYYNGGQGRHSFQVLKE